MYDDNTEEKLQKGFREVPSASSCRLPSAQGPPLGVPFYFTLFTVSTPKALGMYMEL